MSKVLNNLAQAEELRTQKYTLALNGRGGRISYQECEAPRNDAHDEETDLWMLSGRKTYLMIGALVLMGLLSAILSFKAFSQIRKANTALAQVAYMMTEQKTKIVNLEEEIAQWNSSQAGPLGGIKEDLAATKQAADRNQQQIAALTADAGMIRSALDDARVTNRGLLDKYISLNNDVRKLMKKN